VASGAVKSMTTSGLCARASADPIDDGRPEDSDACDGAGVLPDRDAPFSLEARHHRVAGFARRAHQGLAHSAGGSADDELQGHAGAV